MKLEFALILLVLGHAAAAESSTTPEPTTPLPTTPKPTPIPDNQNDYIQAFMSRAISITEDNLFATDWKKESKFQPIFNYKKGTTQDIATVEFVHQLPSREVQLYMHEPDLHPLLKASIAVLYPGNYSYQLYHSTYYGRVSAETFLSIPKFEGTLVEIVKENLTKEFVDDAETLFGSKNYTDFIAKYGQYYFSSATFGGILRMQTHVTNKFVRDVSENEFKLYLAEQLKQTVGLITNISLSYDFYYHSHSDNSTFGGNPTINVSVPGEGVKWLASFENFETVPIVPIVFYVAPISDLIDCLDLETEKKNEIVKQLNATIENDENKFKIKSYMEAMDVVRNNPYGRALGGWFDAEFLYKYFEGKLNNVTLDEDFYENAWAAEHNAQAILNRRGWFQKPYPPEPTTKAPTTEPTKSTATTEATTKKA